MPPNSTQAAHELKIVKEGLSMLNRTFGHGLVVFCTILSMCGKFLASQEFDLE